MKFKNISFIFFFLGLLIFSRQSSAADIPFFGTAYGEQIGLIHMNYKTAKNPDESIFTSSQYYVGPTKQFYISPYDIYFNDPTEAVPNFLFTFTLDFVSRISIDNADCNIATGCLLKGYMWSDTIGWIALEGQTIQNGIADNGGDINLYPPSMFPRISLTNGAMTGLAWNEHTGWIMLSWDSDQASPIGANSTTGNQESPTNANWGVFMDKNEDPTERTFDRGTPGDPSDDLPIIIGRKLQGFAWSEKLGWIKFEENGPELPGIDFGVFSQWVPDTTPPEMKAPNSNEIWFAVGVNSGDLGATNNIVWTHFAEDPESGISIDPALTSLTLTTDSSSGFEGCPTSNPFITKQTNALDADISFTNIGKVGLPDVRPSKGYCKYALNGTVSNGVGNIITIKTVTIYVRAGNVDPTKSGASVVGGITSALADGVKFVTLEAELRDLAGNPIRAIDCTESLCADRTVDVTAELTNNLGFDARIVLNEFSPVTPVKANDELLYDGTYIGEDEISPVFIDMPLNTDVISDNEYYLDLASYAPTSSWSRSSGNVLDKELKITNLEYSIDNNILPSTNSDGSYNQSPSTDDDALDQFLEPTPGWTGDDPVQFAFTFDPPVTTTALEPLEGITQDQIFVGQPITVGFNVVNTGETLNGSELSIDNVFSYDDTGNSTSSALETQEIDIIKPTNTENTEENPAVMGWKDPESGEPGARFEIYDGPTLAFDGTNSPFAEAFTIVSTFNNHGNYQVDPFWGIPHPFDEIVDPETKAISYNAESISAAVIDRSDRFSGNAGSAALLTLAGGDYSSGGTESEIELTFIPQNFAQNVTIADASLNLRHEISYAYSNQPLPTYYAQTPFDDFNIRNLGLEAIGTVAGEQRVTGRKFETVGTTSTKKLQEQIRRNVARLAQNIPNPCPIPSADLATFPGQSDNCVFEEVPNSNNGPLFAYYEGDPSETLVLDNNGSGLAAPNRPYTIIIKGGARLFIKDNVYYAGSSTSSSLGFILIADENGDGADVFISPTPTNMAGSLYAEGSLLSKNAADNLFYGQAGGNPSELNNQLYWQGSIASRNTIGGAPSQELPAGIDFNTDCNSTETALACAQRYDLDYLRRFAVIENPAGSGKHYISNDGLFSGGGSCDSGGNCTFGLGTLGPDYSVIDPSNMSDPNLSETAPFFIEKFQKALNNPPPGFTVTTGIETYQEIR